MGGGPGRRQAVPVPSGPPASWEGQPGCGLTWTRPFLRITLGFGWYVCPQLSSCKPLALHPPGRGWVLFRGSPITSSLESPGTPWRVREEGLGDCWGLCLFWTQQGLFLGWQMEVVAGAGIIRQQACGLGAWCPRGRGTGLGGGVGGGGEAP